MTIGHGLRALLEGEPAPVADIVRYIYTVDEYQQLEREKEGLEAQVQELREELDRHRRRSLFARLGAALSGD